VAIGFNQRSTGLLFVMDDGTGGISVFNSNKNYDYTMQEGDSVYAQGTVAQFRGLTQIALDTLWKVNGSTPIYTPALVSTLGENTENKLIKLKDVSFETTPTGTTWPTANTSINIITASNEVLVIRLLATSTLAGKALPTTATFSITGLGGQFTTATPALDGYQIIPRIEADIVEITDPTETDSIGDFSLITPANNTVITLDSPYTSSYTISWHKPSVFGDVDSVRYYFDVDTINGDLSSPYISIETLGDINDTTIVIAESELKDIMDGLDVLPGQVFYGKWEIYAESVQNTDVFNTSTEIRNITIDYVKNVGLKNIGFTKTPSIYPNPANVELNIIATEIIQHINLYNAFGKLVISKEIDGLESKLNIENLSKGLYFIELKGANGQHLTKQIIIN
jgi:hypothetical protein